MGSVPIFKVMGLTATTIWCLGQRFLSPSCPHSLCPLYSCYVKYQFPCIYCGIPCQKCRLSLFSNYPCPQRRRRRSNIILRQKTWQDEICSGPGHCLAIGCGITTPGHGEEGEGDDHDYLSWFWDNLFWKIIGGEASSDLTSHTEIHRHYCHCLLSYNTFLREAISRNQTMNS